MTVTTDGWVRTTDANATFISATGDTEHWEATHTAPGLGAVFQYVIYCFDYRDVGGVRRIYDNDGGNTFRNTASW